MDSLFHFVFPMIAALAARVHIKHPIRNILIAATLAVLVDLDHVFGIPRVTTHNIFLLILIPLIFVMYTFIKRKFYQQKGLSILILLFLASHLFLDVFTGGVALFYPLSSTIYGIDFGVPITWTSIQGEGLEGYAISSLGVGISLFFLLIVLPCLFLDEIIEKMETKHEDFRRALKDIMKKKPKSYYNYS
ncbi:MAG: metal-dependent hydrolase [Candidatus Aenigmarchaeota archaeon]|nr:metal-dependent hydrolase [Candidatus Aenigmarchaeota archaeon]